MDEMEYVIIPRKEKESREIEREWMSDGERKEHDGNPAANIIEWLS